MENKTKIFHKTNWTLFKNILIFKKLHKLKIRTPEDIDVEVKKLQDKIIKAKDEASTIKKVHHQYLKLPDEIMQLIALRNRQRKVHRLTQNPADKQKLNRYNKLIKIEVQHYRNQRWAELLVNIANDERRLWDITKAIRNPRNISRPLHGPNGLEYYDEEKTEIFARSLENQFTENYTIADILHDEEVIRQNDNYFNNNQSIDTNTIQCITTREILNTIKKLKSHKAPGKDKITNVIIKQLPVKYVARLAAIYNRCLALGYFPSPWKHAITVLFPKSGKDLKFPDSYRPISLLGNLGKLFEKLIYARLKPHLSFLPQHQFGFREGRGTD